MKKIKENAIAKQKVIIAELRENCSSESSREIEIAKLNLMVGDFEKDNNVIDKENINLYYEFMSFDDILNNLDLLNDVLFERYFCILNHFKEIGFINEDKNTYKSLRDWEQICFKNKHIKKDGYKYYEISFFDIKDTLKPIDEYIADIKNHEAYKSYIAKVS